MEENYLTIKDLGTGVTRVGMASLFLLAISASITLDILILIAKLKSDNENGNNQQSFLTGYLLGTMRNRHNPSNNNTCSALRDLGDLSLLQGAGVMVVATAPAIGLTAGLAQYYYQRPDICNGFLIAWGAATGLVAVGLIMHVVGNRIQKNNQDRVSLYANTVSVPEPIIAVQATPVTQDNSVNKEYFSYNV